MTHSTPDHPIVRNMESIGYPDGKAPHYPCCSICGEECEFLYTISRGGDVVGCDICLTKHDAWEREDCFPGKELPWH